MIQEIRLQNFKRYKELSVNLSPLVTLLVGPNSSGKSSIIKSLLAFKQTFEDQGDHSGFLSKGPYVDIGPFVEYTKNHNNEQNTTFLFRLGSMQLLRTASDLAAADIRYTHEADPQTGHGRIHEYQIVFHPKTPNDTNGKIGNLYDSSFSITYSRMQKSEESYKIMLSGNFSWLKGRLSRFQGLKFDWDDVDKINFYLQKGSIQAKRSAERGMTSQLIRGSEFGYQAAMTLLEQFFARPVHQEFVSSLTDRLFALAALRDEPQRSGPRTDERVRVGSRGQNTVSVFQNLRQRAIRAGQRHSLIREDYERLEKWIKRLKIAENFEVTNWRDLLDMRASFGKGPSQSHSIVDLGVGVSQALPILVQLAVAPRNSTLILEQPELHLYPWAQSELGNVICNEAKRGSKSLIIETHSEHIVRGVQKHISESFAHGPEKFLTADEVQVLFVHGNGEVQRLALDETGEFKDRWPPGFFDQGLEAFDVILQNKMTSKVGQE